MDSESAGGGEPAAWGSAAYLLVEHARRHVDDHVAVGETRHREALDRRERHAVAHLVLGLRVARERVERPVRDEQDSLLHQPVAVDLVDAVGEEDRRVAFLLEEHVEL